MKLQDSELHVMEVLWKKGDVTAKEVADILSDSIGWNKNTTYTLIKRCIEKGAIERQEPHFICHALVNRETVQESAMDEVIDKLFDGSVDLVVAALISRKKLSPEEIQNLRRLVDELE